MGLLPENGGLKIWDHAVIIKEAPMERAWEPGEKEEAGSGIKVSWGRDLTARVGEMAALM
jgi:hypothetical protein